MNAHLATRRLIRPSRPTLRLVLSAFVLPAFATLLAGCATTDAEGEAVTASGEAVPVPINSFARQWASNADLERGDRITEVHVREDTVFTYSRKGNVAAMDRATGTLKYIVKVPGGSNGRMHPPVVLKDHVVIPTVSRLEIYERQTGREWTNALTGRPNPPVSLPFAIRSDAVGAGNTVFLGGDYRRSGRVAAIDITRPYVPTVWELMVVKGGLEAAPTLHGDALYIGAGDGTVIAVRAADREPIWPLPGNAFQTGGPIQADLASDDDGVYVASTDGKLYALNRNSGQVIWQFFAEKPLEAAPVATPDAVYQFIPNGGIAAFRKAEDPLPGSQVAPYNRTPRWLIAGGKSFLSQDKDNTYLLLDDNTIQAVDKSTGEYKFKSKTRNLTIFGTNTKDGIIYAATPNGRVMAVRPVLEPGVVGEIVRGEAPTEALATEVLATAR